MNDLVIQAMNAITEVKGVPQKGGKVYKQVKDRVEVFRRHCGFDFGIQTEILDHNDQKVIVQCKIFNSEGFQIGSGLAEEIRGKVNENDCVLAITTSGESANILRGLETCIEKGIKTCLSIPGRGTFPPSLYTSNKPAVKANFFLKSAILNILMNFFIK